MWVFGECGAVSARQQLLEMLTRGGSEAPGPSVLLEHSSSTVEDGVGGVGQRGKWTESENWHLLRILLIRLRCDAALGQSGWPTLVPSGSQDDSHWSHHGPATGVILAPASVFTAKVVASEKGQAGGINGSHDPDQDPMRRADGVTSRGWRTCCRDAAAGVPGHIGRKGHVTPARPVFLAAKPLLCTSTA